MLVGTYGPWQFQYCYLGLNGKKPIFGFPTKLDSNQSAPLQREAGKLKFHLVAILDMILSKKRITEALIRLRRCAGWSAPLLFANPLETGFLESRTFLSQYSSGGPSAPYRDDLNNQYNEESRYNQYTGGLSEEEQIRRATEESRRQTGGSL